MPWSININIIKCIYCFRKIEFLLPVLWIEEWLSFLGLLLCAKHCTRFSLVWIHFKGKCSNCAEFQGALLRSCCHWHHSSTSASLHSSLQVRAPKSNFLPSNSVTRETCKRSWKQTGKWAFGTGHRLWLATHLLSPGSKAAPGGCTASVRGGLVGT